MVFKKENNDSVTFYRKPYEELTQEEFNAMMQTPLDENVINLTQVLKEEIENERNPAYQYFKP